MRPRYFCTDVVVVAAEMSTMVIVVLTIYRTQLYLDSAAAAKATMKKKSYFKVGFMFFT